MARLRRIFIIHTTAKKEIHPDAATDAAFQLTATSSTTANFVQPFDNLAHNERELGRTDEYTFDIPNNRNIDSGNTELTMEMSGPSTNGWLPSSIWAIGQTDSGEHVILGAHPRWRGGWFDRGSNAAGPDKHRIDN